MKSLPPELLQSDFTELRPRGRISFNPGTIRNRQRVLLIGFLSGIHAIKSTFYKAFGLTAIRENLRIPKLGLRIDRVHARTPNHVAHGRTLLSTHIEQY